MSENNNETVNLKLKRFIENIERLNDEKSEISRQITDIYREAKAFGFDTKAMREIIKQRKIKTEERIELSQLIETYKDELGMLG